MQTFAWTLFILGSISTLNIVAISLDRLYFTHRQYSRLDKLPFADISFSEYYRKSVRREKMLIPAMIGVISAISVGFSINLVYGGSVNNKVCWQVVLGIIVLILSAVAIYKALSSVVENGASPSLSATDPFSIRAAALEYIDNSKRATLIPEDLTDNVDHLTSALASHSYELPKDPIAIRREEILKPAMIGVFSAFSVGFSINLIYGGSVNNKVSWQVVLGFVILALSVVTIYKVLNSIVENGASPSNLGTDPFWIRATTLDYMDNPNCVILEPEVLADNLKHFESNLALHSFGLPKGRDASRALSALDDGLKRGGFFTQFRATLSVYFFAITVSFWRFTSPIVVMLSPSLGSFLIINDAKVLPWWIQAALWTILFILSVLAILIHCLCRASCARLKHCAYSHAIKDARRKLDCAMCTKS